MTPDSILLLEEKRYTSYGLTPRLWENAKPIGEAAKKVGFSVERMLELVAQKVCPHFVVDGGEPRFHIPTLNRWIGENLVETVQGAELPFVVVQNVSTNGSPAEFRDVPEGLRSVAGLRVLGFGTHCSGIYFLCDAMECVYVGQAKDLASRAAAHGDMAYDRAYYIPVLQENVDVVEKQFIAALLPKYNKCSFTKKLKRDAGVLTESL